MQRERCFIRKSRFIRKSGFKIILSLLLVGYSCVEDKPPDPAFIDAQLDGSFRVFVCNEGNFQFGNSSVSLILPQDSLIVNNYYNRANDKALGDVCQSITFFQNKAYIVVNNSSKVVVVDDLDFKEIGVISDLESPRYVLPISNSKAYVSDLYADAIHVVNLNTLSKESEIFFPGWTEEMCLIYGFAFVTCRAEPYLYVVETIEDNVVDSIAISKGAGSIVIDQYDRIWVSCSSGVSGSTSSSLYCIDPISRKIIQSFNLGSGEGSISNLELNSSKDSIYFMNEHIYKMSVTADELPSTAFISSEGRLFYGLGVYPKNGDVFISDAIDYNQRGRIFHYSSGATQKGSYLAGIIPGSITFQ